MLRRDFLSYGAAAFLAGAATRTRAAVDSDKSAAYEVSELRYQGGSGRVLFPELAEDLGYLAPIKLNWVGNTISGPQDIQATVTRDVDFGAAFNGSIEKLIAAGAPIKAVVGFAGTDKQSWRGAYVLEDSPIKEVRDFIGKKVGVNTLGAHYEFVIDEYLKRGGLTDAEIKEVILVVLPQPNVEQALRQKQIDVAFLDDIFRLKAVARGGVRLLFSDYDLFGTFTSASYILTLPFIKKNPNAARKFVEATARAIDWTETQPRAEVVARFEDIIKKRGRSEDPSAISFWKSPGLGGRAGLLSDENFSLFIEWFAKNGDQAVGRLRAADVYTNEFNPFRSVQGQ